jgi:hypothetical protein
MHAHAHAIATDDSGSSFAQRLVTKIVDNLQVEINKVHIRFEDFTTNKEVSEGSFVNLATMLIVLHCW